MADITMDLQLFRSLMALGLQRRRAVFQDIHNVAAVKGGTPQVTDPGSVILTPVNPSATLPLEAQVISQVKARIAAAS
ncbi:hypothetical protein OG562_20235 [Streptomyces sp. NBC_01275]|uniref:hypothetical protein n=1 Tax=Streptomyces sp. NBC_01275 TaxID=2903807 RepID=UPI00225373B3|nr:hypothetical protein [Streptomyces sp. NBC_01275]MCX4763255.1 hypothetical protein [Streptomyces sp. NBC_01275]